MGYSAIPVFSSVSSFQLGFYLQSNFAFLKKISTSPPGPAPQPNTTRPPAPLPLCTSWTPWTHNLHNWVSPSSSSSSHGAICLSQSLSLYLPNQFTHNLLPVWGPLFGALQNLLRNVTPSLYSDYWMQNLNIIEHQIFHGRFLFFFHAEGFVFFVLVQ